ncbi:MAG: hypothetical protein PHS56_04080 [Eubacteriales bacterium]|nr:hypothetical protein [Eubacteriales bacterium]MDD3073600.1 hypothetical protein [Eubacteriales bacterium]MDD4079708.1 hypothetical protein [Eubacteriales bacterium]HBI55283.1 hypothetical protein [Bacillota bacterium]HBS94114.1 hypothetical protein [Bacillota bacterium]
MQEQNIRTALEKLRAQKLRRVDLHKLLDSIDGGKNDMEIAQQFNVDVVDVQLIRRVLRE